MIGRPLASRSKATSKANCAVARVAPPRKFRAVGAVAGAPVSAYIVYDVRALAYVALGRVTSPQATTRTAKATTATRGRRVGSMRWREMECSAGSVENRLRHEQTQAIFIA